MFNDRVTANTRPNPGPNSLCQARQDKSNGGARAYMKDVSPGLPGIRFVRLVAGVVQSNPLAAASRLVAGKFLDETGNLTLKPRDHAMS
jgi:hypothetical protein